MKTINICSAKPNWNACDWRDENTILSKDYKYILCHTQNPKHKCCYLQKVEVENDYKI